jgi:hypothetical protein
VEDGRKQVNATGVPGRITIIPAKAPIRGRIRPPGSKSITNRVLLIAALASGESVLEGGLESDDRLFRKYERFQPPFQCGIPSRACPGG